MFETEGLKRMNMLERYISQLSFVPPALREERLQRKVEPLMIVMNDFFKRRHEFDGKRLRADECPVHECLLSIDERHTNSAHVLIWDSHAHVTIGKLPKQRDRRTQQIWVWQHHEAPGNTYFASNQSMQHNWTANYRHDSTFWYPYGLYVPNEQVQALKRVTRMQYEHIYKPSIENKTKLAVAVMTNCFAPNNRWGFIEEMRKYIPVDILGHGHCCSRDCPGSFLEGECWQKLSNEYKCALALLLYYALLLSSLSLISNHLSITFSILLFLFPF